jgi:hypothetical protein
MSYREEDSCKDCKERHVGCHSTCKRHHDKCERERLKKEAILKARRAEWVVDDYIIKRVDRTKKKMKRRK